MIRHTSVPVPPTTQENQAHREAVVTPADEIARTLQAILTRRLTAYIANVKSGKTVTRWANGEVSGIRPASEQRVRAAYEIVQLFEQATPNRQFAPGS